jgi:hypothetical protein
MKHPDQNDHIVCLETHVNILNKCLQHAFETLDATCAIKRSNKIQIRTIATYV